MPFFDFDDVVENIVDELFLDKQHEDGTYYPERLPKNFLKLALVSHTFLNPVRRNLYRDVRIEGSERFLLLTGQLRFSPHLAKFVCKANLVSTCTQSTHIDGGGGWDDPTGSEPRTVSITALRWFLDACPQLTALNIFGGEFLHALALQTSDGAKRLTDITLIACNQCESSGPMSCMDAVEAGWLKNIVAFPRLKELELSEFQIGGPGMDAVRGIPSRSSSCTGLCVSNMNKPLSPSGLKVLLRSMPHLAELVLDGRHFLPPRELKECLKIVAGALTLLTITDYYSSEERADPWENDTVQELRQLKTLSLNGVPVTPPFLNMLPPRLEHLRLSGGSLVRVSAPIIVAWLRRDNFPLRRVLKKLEMVGEVRTNAAKGAPAASDQQLAEIARLCRALSIEWIHKKDQYTDFF
ncbi:hypothetical protein R3P38DRAFT_2904819 [Favolaschia claudopus]|uniref:F-box protein n=1 Tax=Favolaschia claudopus TaxID=2862362 RepID=A0AAW0CEX2_9AGAR